MNTMRSTVCRYQAITNDGKVHFLGYASEFTYGEMVRQSSSFGGKCTSYGSCIWDNDDDSLPPADLIRILNPVEISNIWSGKSSCGSGDLEKMFSFCNIAEDAVVGMILTFEEEGRWDFQQNIETIVVPRLFQKN